MVACRQTWCPRRSCEFYILICRKQEAKHASGYSLSIGNLSKATPTPSKPCLLIVPLSMAL